jgi:hypothetical protein
MKTDNHSTIFVHFLISQWRTVKHKNPQPTEQNATPMNWRRQATEESGLQGTSKHFPVKSETTTPNDTAQNSEG